MGTKVLKRRSPIFIQFWPVGSYLDSTSDNQTQKSADSKKAEWGRLVKESSIGRLSFRVKLGYSAVYFYL